MSPQALWTAQAGRTACDVQFGRDTLPVDIDQAAGGSGEHPSPHDLLDAALAACTTLTLQLYARRKGMAVQEVQVEVRHERDGAAYRMVRAIRVVGTLTEEQQAGLLRVADACPVHKTLVGEIAIVTQAHMQPAASTG